MKNSRFFSKPLILFLTVLLLWSLPSSGPPQARAAMTAKQFIRNSRSLTPLNKRSS